MKKQQTQSGFAAVELALILVIAALIGVVGWMVYKNRPTTTTSNANNSVINDAKQSPSSSATTTSTNMSKVTELGIQFTTPPSLNDLVYSSAYTDGDKVSVIVSTTELGKSDAACTVPKDGKPGSAGAPLGRITKVTGIAPANGPGVFTPAEFIKRFDGFYILYTAPQMGYCSTDPAVADKAKSNIELLKTALVSAKVL